MLVNTLAERMKGGGLGLNLMIRHARTVDIALAARTCGFDGLFFDLQHGLKLAVWPRRSLAHDSGLEVSPPSATDVSLGHNVSSKAAVDLVMEQASTAGATIVKAAQDTFWGGYAGYFQDPDGHLWEVVYNPDLLPDGD